MSQEIINYGAAPNDGTGDPLRVAFIKTDNNFDQIWAAGPVGSNITILNNTIQVTNTNGNLELATNGTGVISTRNHVRPSVSQVYDLGTTNLRYRSGYFTGLNIDGNVTITGNLSAGNISYTSNVFVGDLKGSVFADDSTIMVDAIDNVLRAGAIYTDDYFYANGNPLVSSYGNANVTALLGNLGSNTISGTGNITTTANVSGNFILGNGRQLTGIVSSYGNANVTTLLGNLGSNTISGTGNITTTANVSGGYILGNGSQLTGLPAQYGNSNVTTLLGNLGSNTISGTGNITTTANVSGAYVKGNGSELTNLPAPTVTPDISSTGDMSIMTYDGVIKSVNYATVEPSSGDIKSAGDISAIGNITAGNLNSPTLNCSGNISVVAGGNTWTFRSTGNLTLPRGGIVYETSIPGGALTGNTIALKPQGGTNADQQLLIYPTVDPSADVNHLHLTTGNLYNTELFLGNDNLYVKLANTGNVVVNTNDNTGNTAQWTFGADGRLINLEGLTLTAGGQFNICTILTGGSGYDTGSALKATTGGSGTGMTVGIGYGLSNQLTNADVVDPGTGYVDGDVITVSGGTGGTFVITRYNEQANQANNNFVESDWTFDADGGTIFPTLTVTRGDRTGSLTGQTLLFGDATQEAIISTPNGTNAIADSQRLVINPGAGAPGTTGEGGDIYLYAGRGGNLGGSGGDIKIRGGLGPVDGAGGYITMEGGEADVNGVGGYIEIIGGVSGNSAGGSLYIYGGQGRTGGDANVTGGSGTAGPGGDVSIIGGASANGQSEYGNIIVATGSKNWTFNNTGNLIVPGGIVGSGASPAPYLSGFSSVSAITVTASGNVTGGNVLTTGIVSATGNVYAGGLISATGNITTAGNFVGNGAALSNVTVSVAGNIIGTSSNVSLVAGSYSWTFNNTGNLTLPGNTFSVNYANNTPVNVVTRFESSWAVPVGNSTQSFTVTPNETYYLWVDCNIPNGILVWNATATVTNNNVPVVGAQYAWVYDGGGTPIDFTSIPNQFVGTGNTIVRGNVAPSATTNRFDFGINNTSGGNVTVRYGWIAIS